MPAQVGVSESDLDAQRAYVRDLDAKLNPAVAKCFAGKPELAQWADLHQRVDSYLSGWSLFVFTSMFFMVGQVLIQQLNAWVPRVRDAGCPIEAPGPPPTPDPGLLKGLMPVSLEQAAVVLGLLWLLSKKIERGLGL